MQYGAQCTMKVRPTSAHAANCEPAAFHKAEMQKFVDAAHADGELDDAERLALTSAKERDLEWTNYTPEQLAAKNKEKTLLSDIFHRKPAHELFCEEAVLRPSEGKPKMREGDNREIWHAVW